MSYETILVAEESGVRTITLNRTESRNAMTPQMQEELLTAIGEASAGDCRIVVLTGAGTAFCAGLDLSALRTMEDQSEAVHKEDAERIARLFRTLYELPKPTIAAVNGAAVAGGAGLATVCDFTLASQGAKFGYTEVKIGFVPALVSAFLTLQIGDKKTRELLLTARLITAEEAEHLGLANEVVPPENLAERTSELAAELKANSPQSMERTKRLLALQNKAWLDAAIQYSLTVNAEARTTHDFREGVAAFLEKRRPVWKANS